MTTIARCFDLAQASQMKARLEASGIDAFIPDETSASVAPHHFLTPSGVRLQVADEHAEDARKILGLDRPAEELD